MMAEQPKARGRALLHDEMLSRIAILESVMAELGHALPPITDQDFLDIKKAIATLKAQPVGRIPAGDFVGAMVAKSTLKKIASKLEENKQALPYWLEILNIQLTKLAQSVSDWVQH
jgi:hypothetical protein